MFWELRTRDSEVIYTFISILSQLNAIANFGLTNWYNVYYFYQKLTFLAQSAGAVEHTDCFTSEG